MLKPLILAALLSSAASFALAETVAAPDPATAASTPKKHRLHAPRLRKGAASAVNPDASADKKGGA